MAVDVLTADFWNVSRKDVPYSESPLCHRSKTSPTLKNRPKTFGTSNALSTFQKSFTGSKSPLSERQNHFRNVKTGLMFQKSYLSNPSLSLNLSLKNHFWNATFGTFLPFARMTLDQSRPPPAPGPADHQRFTTA